MKDPQLKSLIQLIVKQLLKEYVSSGQREAALDAKAMSGQDTITNPSPEDLTPIERAKAEREKRMEKDDDLKTKTKELDVAKKEMEFQKQKVDQNKRFAVPNLTKDIQRLKSQKI